MTQAELDEEARQTEHDYQAAWKRIAFAPPGRANFEEAWLAMYKAARKSVKAKRRAGWAQR